MELDLRKQRILDAIVQDYVATAEPVGSHILVERYALGVKSATVRNEMAELSERGFLVQPHTSAGRVPSGMGYRFYVRELMRPAPLLAHEARESRQSIASAASDLEAILRKTCQLLASLTRLPAVATSPDADDTQIRQIFLTPVSSEKALLVVLLSTGRTENRLLPDLGISANEALRLANALNASMAGATLASLRAPESPMSGAPHPIHSAAWSRLRTEIASIARGLADESPVFVEGTPAALRLPEFRDVERLGHFLRLLQERAALLEVLVNGLDTAPVTVRIGDELGHPERVEFAVVTSPYFVGSRERGTLAVVGPIRMDYGRATVAVRFLAETLTQILSRLS